MKIIITENQYKKLQEDLEYWGVSDASPNSDEYEMGVELDEDVNSIPIYKEVNPQKNIYEKMRMEFPNTPEYILQDYFRNIILMNAPYNVPPIRTIKNTYFGDPIPYIKGDGDGWWYNYLKGPWKLQVLDVNPMSFIDKTIKAFEQRNFGEENAYDVPKDEERMETQMNMRRSDGNNEPVILLQNPDGKYELMEGWHRTMSILQMGDNGDGYENWDKVKLRSFVAPSPDYIKKN